MIPIVALVVLQLTTVAFWFAHLFLDGPGITPYDPGERLYLLPPAVFGALGTVGFLALRRVRRDDRRRRSATILKVSSASTLVPLFLYVALEALFIVSDIVFPPGT